MLVSDILTRVQRAFGDESGAQIDSADVIRWVNDAQAEIARQKELLQVTTTATVTSGVGAYVTPTNILQLRSVKYDGMTLDPISFAQAEEMVPNYDAGVASVGSGTPTTYWVWGGFINLYPIPNNSTSVLKMYYTRIPVAVTVVGDTPELPVQYHLRIVDYCIAKAHELDANPQGEAMKMAAFNTGIAQTDMDLWQPKQAYPNITVSIDDTWLGY
jgi:hypothetical protein